MSELSGARIIFVNSFPGPRMGGGEVQLRTIVRACASAGMAVTLVCPRDSGLVRELGPDAIEIVEMDASPRRLARNARDLRALAVEREARVLQGTGFFTNVLTRIAARGMPSLAVVNAVHVVPGASLHDGGSRTGLFVRSLIERGTQGRADRFVAVSDAVARAMERRFRIPREKIVIIRNGVDPEKIRREAVGPLPPGTPGQGVPLVGVVGRLEPVKGVDDFVRAAALVAPVHTSVQFVVAGTGRLGPRLEHLAREAGLERRIHFLGHVSPAAPLLARLAVLAIPSLSEGLPMVALEAMALGIPVVATRVGGVPEVVEDGVNGWLVPPRETKSLAEAIGSLLSDPERAASFGAVGRRRVEEGFTLSRMTGEYLELYSGVIGNRV